MKEIVKEFKKANKLLNRNYPTSDIGIYDCIDIATEVIEDLIEKYESLKNDYEDFQKDVEKNYKPITREEQIYG